MSPKSPMAVVLCVGKDDVLLTTRRMILERAGHKVLQAKTLSEIRDAVAKGPVDVAVIGQGLAPVERVQMGELVRRECPGCKLLELYIPSQGKAVKNADDWMEVPSDAPPELAQRVSALVKKH